LTVAANGRSVAFDNASVKFKAVDCEVGVGNESGPGNGAGLAVGEGVGNHQTLSSRDEEK